MLTFKAKILGIQGLTILATVLLLGVLSYILMVNYVSGTQKRTLEYIARDTAGEVERYLEFLGRELEHIEIEDYHRKLGELPLAKYLIRYQQTFPLLAYLDGQGREQLRLVNGRIALTTKNWADLPIVRQARRAPNQVVVSTVDYSSDLQGPVLRIALNRVLYFGDEDVGTLIAELPIRALTGQFTETQVGETGYIALVSPQGDIHISPGSGLVVRSNPNSSSGAELSTLVSRQEGFATLTLGEQSVVAALAPVPSLGWAAMAVLPFDEFMAAPHRLRLIAAVICIGVLAVGLSGAMWFSCQLTANLEKVIRQTEAISRGDFDRRLELQGEEEIVQLARSFNAMSESLQKATLEQQSLNNILQSIIDPLVVCGTDKCIVQVNHAAQLLFNLSRAELLGRPFFSLLSPDDPLLKDGACKQRLEAGPIRNYETKVVCSDGSEVPVLLSCSQGRQEQTERGVIVGILKDITDRKQAAEERQRALEASEAAHDRVSAILKSVSEGLLVTDPQRRIILMNQAAESMLGFQLSEVLQRPVEAAIGDPVLRDHLLATVESRAFGSPVDLELDSGKTGRGKIIQACTSQVKNRDREQTGVITSLRDVTQERHLERMKNEFISTAAHELRTPLTSVLGYAEFLLNPEEFGGFDPAQQKEFVQEIYDKAEVLSGIVSELLDISRIESGQQIPLERKLVDLDQTVNKVVRHFQIHYPNHRFEVQLEEDLAGHALVDEQKMVQVLENLISNAVKYSHPGSMIQVERRARENSHYFSVQDQGIGMSEEQIGRVFDKFYRVDASDTAVGGLGLGMSIVKAILQAHQGRIWVESQLGRGTRVSFCLPVAAE